eukprot:RCo048320
MKPPPLNFSTFLRIQSQHDETPQHSDNSQSALTKPCAFKTRKCGPLRGNPKLCIVSHISCSAVIAVQSENHRNHEETGQGRKLQQRGQQALLRLLSHCGTGQKPIAVAALKGCCHLGTGRSAQADSGTKRTPSLRRSPFTIAPQAAAAASLSRYGLKVAYSSISRVCQPTAEAKAVRQKH